MTSPLVEQVLTGENRSLTMMAARGLLPIPPSELVSLQVELAAAEDREVAETAKGSLAEMERRVLLPLLDEAEADVLRYFATASRDSEVLERIIRRRDVPTDVLTDLAPRISTELQEILLLRQDRIVESPEIIRALEDNEQLSSFARRRIGEYREHLVVPEARAYADEAPPAGAEAPAPGEEPEERSPLEDPEVALAVAEVKEAAPETETDGEVEEITGLSEGEIGLLPVPVRLKLARGASRTMRSLLIRDSNPQVAVAVLTGNAVGDQEVEQIAKSRSVVEDVLEKIATERRWIQKYPVAHALVCNPRTPVGIAVRLVPRLSIRDLRNLSRDRNVPDAVRSTAKRIYKVKSQ